MVTGPLHSDVKGGPLHLQFRAPPPGRALHATAIRSICTRTGDDAGLPHQEPERPSIQEARAVELYPPFRLVVGEGSGKKGSVGFHVNQREGGVASGTTVGFGAEVHKHTGVAKGDMEGGPKVEPRHRYKRGGRRVKDNRNKDIIKNMKVEITIKLFAMYLVKQIV